VLEQEEIKKVKSTLIHITVTLIFNYSGHSFLSNSDWFVRLL